MLMPSSLGLLLAVYPAQHRAAALAALLSGAYVPAEREAAGVLACGGNVDIAAVLDAAA